MVVEIDISYCFDDFFLDDGYGPDEIFLRLPDGTTAVQMTHEQVVQLHNLLTEYLSTIIVGQAANNDDNGDPGAA